MLPNEILALVFENLPYHEIYNTIRHVNARWRDIVDSSLVRLDALELVKFLNVLELSDNTNFNLAILKVVNCRNRFQDAALLQPLSRLFVYCCLNKPKETVLLLINSFRITREHSQIIPEDILVVCCRHARFDMLKFLCETLNFTIEDIRYKNNFILTYSCCYNHIEILEWLVSKYNLREDDFATDFYVAFRTSCNNENIQVTKLLLERCNPDQHTLSVCLRKACESDHFEIAELLLESFIPDNDTLIKLLQKTCKHGNLKTTELLFSKVSPSEDTLLNLLKISCKYGNSKITELFLEEVDPEKDILIDLLMDSCEKGHLEIFVLLLQKIIPDLGNKVLLLEKPIPEKNILMNCLLLSCKNGHTEIAEEITKTVNIGPEDIQLYFPRIIFETAKNEEFDAVVWILSHFDIKYNDLHSTDSILLRASCNAGNLGFIKWCHKRIGFTTNDVSALDYESLRTSCINGFTLIVKFLVTEFNLSRENIEQSLTPFLSALKESYHSYHNELVQWLVDHFEIRKEDFQTAKIDCDLFDINFPNF